MSGIKPKKIGLRERIIILLLAVVMIALSTRLFYLQILSYEEYQKKVLENITRETEISATRGSILDRNNIVLAENVTVERVFISPVDIEDEETRVLVSRGLSEILNVDYDEIYERAGRANRKDETVKRNVEKEDADKVRAFIVENNLNCVHLVTGTKRYYPFANLLSHTLGFCGSDGQGLYGLELQYDEYLTGVPGKIITAKNGLGQDMPYDYEQYIAAENGYNLILTIDYNVQSILEKYLEDCYEESGAANRVTAIIMDPNDGGILAMATKPDFNCNDPYTLDPDSETILITSGFDPESDDYSALKAELLMKMWNNKAVTEIYEPGSTFKPITITMAFEENLVTTETPFYCPGYHFVPGYGNIKCHKTAGHGHVSLALGLLHSCNPTLMTVAERITEEPFYNYFKAFGYTEKTGIDLPGESDSYYHPYSSFNQVELAVYSFGQTFKITPIQHITGLSAVANGGELLTPHIVKQIVDDEGNVIVNYEKNVRRVVSSKESANTVINILGEGVTSGEAMQNAYVSGQKIAAKTGTSEKRDKPDKNGNFSLRVASCVSIAPYDNPQAVLLTIVDEPTLGRPEGSLIAAPYNAKILAEVLPYLGIEPEYQDSDLKKLETNISDYTGMSVSEAKAKISELGISVKVVGDGGTVVSQMPKAGSTLVRENGFIILYTGGESEGTDTVVVPDILGKKASEVNETILGGGLNLNITGTSNISSAVAVKQYPEAGSRVPRGTVVTVDFRNLNDIPD